MYACPLCTQPLERHAQQWVCVNRHSFDIAKEGYEEIYGARPLKRAIQSKIEDRLAEEILDGRIKEGDAVQVVTKEAGIDFQVVE